MMFPAHIHNMLVEAGQASIRARGGNGRMTRRHNTALAELDDTIGKVMDAAPTMFTDKAWRELDKKRRDTSD